MTIFLLLVIWVIPGQPPISESYQLEFNSAKLCEAARDALLAEGARFQGTTLVDRMSAPKVSAVCVAPRLSRPVPRSGQAPCA